MPVAFGQRIGGDGGGCRHFRVVQAMLCMVQAMHFGAADFAPLCSAPPSPHDSRLAGLGARVGDRGGGGMNQHFRNLSLPLVKAPAKGQYETKLQSQAPQSPCRLSKGCCQPTLRLTNALVTKPAIGGREGQLGVECQTGG